MDNTVYSTMMSVFVVLAGICISLDTVRCRAFASKAEEADRALIRQCISGHQLIVGAVLNLGTACLHIALSALDVPGLLVMIMFGMIVAITARLSAQLESRLLGLFPPNQASVSMTT